MKYRFLLLLSTAALALAQQHPLNPLAPPETVPPPPPSPQTPRTSQPAARPAPARSASAAAPSVRDLKFPALKPIEIPPVETFTLPNGMKVFLLEDHELPLVHGAARIRTGNLFDPADKIGLATMTGMVMRTGGTKSKTGDELDIELENIAASVETSIEETFGSASFSTLVDNTDEVMGIFHDVLTAPEFRPEKIDLAKTQERGSISRRNDDARNVAVREFANTVYGKDTPYGWEEQYDTVARVTRADMVEFYQRYFFPANVMLAVWGDFKTPDMKAKLQKLFADWTVTQQPVPPFPKVTLKPAPGMFLAVKTEIAQTFFSMGQWGSRFDDKEYPALEIMADILGGGFQSRLLQRVRTRMGNAYDIAAYWGANYDHAGLFEISGSTKSMSTVETLKAVQEEVDRIRTAEVSEEELKTAKDTALNSLVFAFDTRSKTILRMLNYEYYGYPRDFIQQYQKALGAVTRADVLRVAKERLHPPEFATIAVGNPDLFVQPLTALGQPVTNIDLTIPGASKEEAAEADEASIQAGKQLLARAQEAAGGADKIAAVKDYSETAHVQVDPSVRGSGGMLANETVRWIAPSTLRQDTVTPRGSVLMYCDGRTGWASSPQGVRPLVNAELKKVQGDIFRVYFRLLLSDRIDGRVVSALDEKTVQIQEGDELARVEFDPQTGLPARVMYETTVVRGAPAPAEEDYSDFRDVNGVKVPYRVDILDGGRKFAVVTVTDYKTNTGLKPADLSKRP
jgi:zinc protease